MENSILQEEYEKIKQELHYGQENSHELYWEENPGLIGLSKLLEVQDKLELIGKMTNRIYSSKEEVNNLINHSYTLIEKYFDDKFGGSYEEQPVEDMLNFLTGKPKNDIEVLAFWRMEKTKLHSDKYKGDLSQVDFSKIIPYHRGYT